MAPGPRELGKAEIDYLDRAWAAVTSPGPEALVRMLGEKLVPLPLLLAAFRFLLYRYPDVASGINRHDAKLLAKTRDRGPVAAGVIAYSMMELGEEGDRAGDLVLWWRLRRLADPALPYRAVTMTGAKTTIRGTEVHLTEIGEQVARGELNFVELNGIDDWVGGVHLDSRTGHLWFLAMARSYAASRSGCGFGSTCPIIKLLSQPRPLRRPDGSAGLLTPPERPRLTPMRPKPSRSSNRFVVVMLSGLILAVGSGIVVLMYSGSGLHARPAAASARGALKYAPRETLDSSGFNFMVEGLPRWKPDSSLEELSRIWQGFGNRSIAEIDKVLPNPRMSSKDRFMLMLTKAAFHNYEGEPNRAYEVLEAAAFRGRER